MKYLIALPVSAFVLSLVACGPSSGESAGGTVAEVAAAVAAHCAPPGDTKSALSLALVQQLPGVFLDPTELSLCAQAMNAGNCDSVHCDLAISEWGTLATGATCSIDAQCTSSSCKREQGATCGTCKADTSCTTPCASGQVCNNGTCMARPKAVAAGGACLDAPCEDGFTCTSGRCAPSPKVGEACDGTYPHACMPGAQCTASKCVALPGEGAACKSNYDCSPTLVCGATGSCRKAVTVALGSPCEFGDICTGGVCARDLASTTGSGKCRAADKAGAPCDGLTCEAGLICGEAQTCVALASLVCK